MPGAHVERGWRLELSHECWQLLRARARGPFLQTHPRKPYLSSHSAQKLARAVLRTAGTQELLTTALGAASDAVGAAGSGVSECGAEAASVSREVGDVGGESSFDTGKESERLETEEDESLVDRSSSISRSRLSLHRLPCSSSAPIPYH